VSHHRIVQSISILNVYLLITTGKNNNNENRRRGDGVTAAGAAAWGRERGHAEISGWGGGESNAAASSLSWGVESSDYNKRDDVDATAWGTEGSTW